MVTRELDTREIVVPNIIAKVPEGAFDAALLARGLTAAAKTVEQIGDHPRQEFTIWVVIEEVKAGFFFAGGDSPLSLALPAIVFVHLPAGVIDEAGRAEAVRLVQAAVAGAKSDADPRPAMTSVIVSEVTDGTWGVNGALWRLGEFAKAAGYKHFQPRTLSSVQA